MKKILVIHTKYRNLGGEDIAVENAWEELKSWKRQLIENYSHKIFPDSRKKDSLENLKEAMYDDPDKISSILKLILNMKFFYCSYLLETLNLLLH